MNHRIFAVCRVLAVGACVALAGCSVEVGRESATSSPSRSSSTTAAGGLTSDAAAGETSSSETSTGTTGSEGATGSAGATGISVPGKPADGTWLFDLPAESTRETGRTAARLAGDASRTTYADSTAQWVGCDGQTDETVYDLPDGVTALRGQVALRDDVPKGIVAEVSVSSDLGEITRLRVEADGGAPLQLNLKGATTLTIRASALEGQCAESDDSYLVLADTWVR